ncbi:histidine ammonia-lyase [Salinirubellus salinus]|uniref:Probable histidine ammonia-lyase n=1 Tax=Salinirubellus salinus TaxID=1364945 RepID=A0A9E7R8B4_9EURY|nr:histidine ammonia-lyase [Salinirubellus salinus]UWM56485.1 histidine ammonia-lyase [Salinirubellus salinus]
MTEVVLDGESLTVAAVVAVAREDATVAVSDAARERVRAARDRVEAVLDTDEPVYGLNTGFGDLVDTRIPRERVADLQTNLVRSHAAGTGPELPREAVRALLLTRVNALVKGYSGVREVVVDHLVTLLNERVHPVVPSRGSLGASGDLAPLAHVARLLLGEGAADVEGASDGEWVPERLPGDEALATAGLEPLGLRAKEGLALVNGTQLTLGLAALLVHDAERLCRAADAAGALTTEVTMGSTVPVEDAIQRVRPHAGQAASARAVRRLCAGSEVVESHRNCDRVQDAYSIRCLPQVHGAVRDAVAHLRAAVETELNSATDNPLVFPAGDISRHTSGTDAADVVSGGNFHGEVLALRLDYVRSALTELAAIAERRVDRLLNPHVQEAHLPPYLTPESGLESGLMIAQYTAASCLAECRSVSTPATDTTPVSGGQEDHVSMSATSAHATRRTLGWARTVVGVELLCAAQAAEFVEEGLAHGDGTAAVYDAVREVVPPLDGDRSLAGDIDACDALVANGALDAAVAEALGSASLAWDQDR